MAWFDWKRHTNGPIQIAGVKDHQITADGYGVEVFANLQEARRVFPDLDPERNGERFTWAMHGYHNKLACIRFETWAAYDMYSSG